MNIYRQDHISLQDSVVRFVEKEINPFVDQWEQEGIFPAHQLFKKMGLAGFLGIDKPAEYGGLGLDLSYVVAFSDALGAIDCMGVPIAIAVQASTATRALADHGSDALKREFLAPSISGDIVACLGISETGAGSDVSLIKTTARKSGDDYVITGNKMWTTNGTQADWMCMLANTGDPAESRHGSKSLICVPMKARGVSVQRKLDKLGLRSSDTAQIFFDEVRVPQRNRIGEEGRGFIYQMEQFQEERLFVAMNHVRPMEKAIADVIEYCSNRYAFGRRIADNQAVRFRLAELKTQIELLRSLIYRAVQEFAAGADVTMLASMAKLNAGRLLREVADSCLQYYGGMGFMNETPISRLYRDGRIASIAGGADEIMLEIISKRMGLPGG